MDAEEALWRLEAWLETMRVPAEGARPAGYGGPVVHWWRDSVVYTGAGFDWRYEGIIHGYLTLYERTGEARWLEKATRAGNDLVAAQLPNGNFMCSGFERNPSTAGTPHEAAADAGLLALAGTLKRLNDARWERFLQAARRNVERFYIARLWSEEEQVFRDDQDRPGFVPNKSCTLALVLFSLAEITGDAAWIERYARPTLDAVLRYQERRTGDRLDGAIAQNSLGGEVVHKYFPYYVARCIPALVAGGGALGDKRYVNAALAAGEFILRARDRDGGFPQVIYPDGALNRYPRWIAAVGDVLSALERLKPFGLRSDLAPSRHWLLRGQLESGAFKVAEGFGRWGLQRNGAAGSAAANATVDARDAAPVVGWNDKAFRYLAHGLATRGGSAT